MNVEWDEEKRKHNLAKHGIDFRDAAAIFAGGTLTLEDTRYGYEERRFLTLGLLQGRVILVVHTERSGTIRVISMRKATKNEQRSYFESI